MNNQNPCIANNLGRWDYISERMIIEATSTPTAGSSTTLLFEAIFYREAKTKEWFIEIFMNETLSTNTRTGATYTLVGVSFSTSGSTYWALSAWADGITSAPKCRATGSTISIEYPSTSTTYHSISGKVPLASAPSVYIPDYFF